MEYVHDNNYEMTVPVFQLMVQNQVRIMTFVITSWKNSLLYQIFKSPLIAKLKIFDLL